MTDLPEWIESARRQWRWRGQARPPFAAAPGPGQVSVWDFPRPPRLAADTREVVVSWDGIEVARTRRAVRVLETAHPPSFYLPWEDVARDLLRPAAGSSFCEWKGPAQDCRVGGAVVRPQPGGFYGGWITPELAGPFKGEPGSGYRPRRRRSTPAAARLLQRSASQISLRRMNHGVKGAL